METNKNLFHFPLSLFHSSLYGKEQFVWLAGEGEKLTTKKYKDPILSSDEKEVYIPKGRKEGRWTKLGKAENDEIYGSLKKQFVDATVKSRKELSEEIRLTRYSEEVTEGLTVGKFLEAFYKDMMKYDSKTARQLMYNTLNDLKHEKVKTRKSERNINLLKAGMDKLTIKNEDGSKYLHLFINDQDMGEIHLKDEDKQEPVKPESDPSKTPTNPKNTPVSQEPPTNVTVSTGTQDTDNAPKEKKGKEIVQDATPSKIYFGQTNGKGKGEVQFMTKNNKVLYSYKADYPASFHGVTGDQLCTINSDKTLTWKEFIMFENKRYDITVNKNGKTVTIAEHKEDKQQENKDQQSEKLAKEMMSNLFIKKAIDARRTDIGTSKITNVEIKEEEGELQLIIKVEGKDPVIIGDIDQKYKNLPQKSLKDVVINYCIDQKQPK